MNAAASSVATSAPGTSTRGQRLRWLASDTLVIARRSAEHIRQIPEKLLDVTIQPVMFVLLFAFVFGGVIAIPGGNYHEYLLGGILIQSLAFGAMGPGISIATDLGEGIVDRFRALPMARSAYLYGHLFAEYVATLLAVCVLTCTGLIVGWRIESSLGEAIAGFGLLFLFAFVMVWLGTYIGVVVRSPDSVMGIAFIGIFPLTFISNAFVPVDGLPDGLQQVAEWNPISAVVAAVRTLFGNPTAISDGAAWPLAHPVVAALAWCAVLLAIFVPLTLRRFRKRTSD